MSLEPTPITYKNLDGEEVTTEFWFSLSESEIAEMKATHQRDIGQYFQRIINANNNQDLIKFYRELLVLAVGIRKGQRMDKSQDVKDEFVQTGAYNALFLKLIQMPDMGASFVNKMFPEDLIKAYEEQQAEDYTDEYLLSISNSHFRRIAGHPKQMDKRMLTINQRRKEMNRERNKNGLTSV